jgi:methionyl-tRNA formyltransferase
VNVHPSVLPRWRGADPVAHAILAGDRETGVCLMEATDELDSGPLITLSVTEIPPYATTGDLETHLAREGARLLEANLTGYLTGKLRPLPQSGKVTWAPKLDPREGHLEFDRPAEELARVVRAYSPDPGAYTLFRGQRLRVLRAAVSGGPPREHGTLKVEEGEPYVAGGAGWLRLDQVQPAGKRVMSGADWARGLRDIEGARLPS